MRGSSFHSVGKSLTMRGEKRLGRKRYPQIGVTGGRAARDEGGEGPLLTNLNFQAKTAKNQLGQPAVAGNEGNEDPPY